MSKAFFESIDKMLADGVISADAATQLKSSYESAIGNAIPNDACRKSEEGGRTSRENHNRQDTGGAGHDVKSNPNQNPGQSSQEGPMGGNMMNFTTMLESLAAVTAGLDTYASADNLNLDDMSVGSPGGGMGIGGGDGETELLEALNQIFTPILVTQSIEGNIADQINEACSADNVLLERNMIKFDDASRMAQLQSVCALLIARQKDSPQFKMFKEAARIRNKAKLEIQKAEFEAASVLAQKYLVNVVSSSNSSVARKAAQDLLPATQH